MGHLLPDVVVSRSFVLWGIVASVHLAECVLATSLLELIQEVKALLAVNLLVVRENYIISCGIKLAPFNPPLFQILTFFSFGIVTGLEPLRLVFLSQIDDELSKTFQTTERVLIFVNF